MKRSTAALIVSALIVACDRAGESEYSVEGGDTLPAANGSAEMNSAEADSARANIVDARGVGIGAVIVTGRDDGVALEGALIGLPPGEHGFHIHETGSCELPIFESAGSHVADGSAHGFDVADGPHPGDLRNLVVGADSTATVDQTNDLVTLRGGSVELLDGDGSALVIHAGPDDYTTQPSGGSGEPIACGVIEG